MRYTLKTPYRDGTTHVIFEPEDFMARLAARVPKPRAHQTRYHGVFAPASPERARIVPGTCHKPPGLQPASTASAANIGPLVRPIRIVTLVVSHAARYYTS